MATTEESGEQGPTVGPRSASEFVRDRLRDAETPKAPAELAREYGCTPGYMQDVCRELHNEEAIQRVEKGLYGDAPGDAEAADSEDDAAEDMPAPGPQDVGADGDDPPPSADDEPQSPDTDTTGTGSDSDGPGLGLTLASAAPGVVVAADAASDMADREGGSDVKIDWVTFGASIVVVAVVVLLLTHDGSDSSSEPEPDEQERGGGVGSGGVI